MICRPRIFALIFSGLALATSLPARTSSTSAKTAAKKDAKVTESARTKKRMAALRHRRAAAKLTTAKLTTAKLTTTTTRLTATTTKPAATKKTTRLRRHRYYERFTASSFADDITDGDTTAGEDPIVRQ